MRAGFMERGHGWLFTVLMALISRGIVAWDRRTGRLPVVDAAMAARSVASMHRIESGGNVLDAVLVRPVGRVRSVLLICHGIGETVEYWQAAQRFLAAQGVVSLVFDYSGYGRSTGRIEAEQLERDAAAAFAYLVRLMPGTRVALLGLSMGSGVAAAVASRVRAERVVLCGAFPSFRDAAQCVGMPRWLRFIVPPIWETAKSLGALEMPVLIVHGERDELFPVRMAEENFACCAPGSQIVVAPGVTHNEPYLTPHLRYWGPILAWIERA